MVKEMMKNNHDCKIPTELVPICPVCHESMEINLRKDAFFVEDEHWHTLQHAYQTFVEENKKKRLVLIELGVGFNTPGIIRFPFERMVLEFPSATLIRVNDRYPDLAFEIQNKVILVENDCRKFIDQLTELS